MRRIVFILWLTFAGGACTNSVQTEETQKPVDKITEKEALNLLHSWTDAYLSGDATPLEEILDDSWVYSGSADGKVTNKAAAIEEFANADYTFEEISYEGLDVRLYDDIAVVRGSERMVILGNMGKDTTRIMLRFTDVYQKKDGKISAISTHSSPVEQDE